jgi:lysozyme
MEIREAISSLVLSAAALVGIALSEGYTDKAIEPLPGDKPTYGFGTTTHADGTPVKMGEKITPPKALERALIDVERFEGAVKKCVTAPLTQYEYDAYLSLAYNIGTANFCTSTLVKKLNAQDYKGACLEILRWDRFQGQPNAGLAKRRKHESDQCLGLSK